ncbi:MAG TPA: hypothetical protein VN522_02980 [Solirubrobacterales bacterium]|nr:hypothetical protein [Solirubrobacterales bacterium]
MSGTEGQQQVTARVLGPSRAQVERNARQQVTARARDLSGKSLEELRLELEGIAGRQAAAAERIRVNSEDFKDRLDAILAGTPRHTRAIERTGSPVAPSES